MSRTELRGVGVRLGVRSCKKAAQRAVTDVITRFLKSPQGGGFHGQLHTLSRTIALAYGGPTALNP